MIAARADAADANANADAAADAAADADADAEVGSTSVDVYLKRVQESARAFLASDAVHPRRDLDEALRAFFCGSGNFGLLLGGKGTGKTKLLRRLAAFGGGFRYGVPRRVDQEEDKFISPDGNERTIVYLSACSFGSDLVQSATAAVIGEGAWRAGRTMLYDDACGGEMYPMELPDHIESLGSSFFEREAQHVDRLRTTLCNRDTFDMATEEFVPVGQTSGGKKEKPAGRRRSSDSGSSGGGRSSPSSSAALISRLVEDAEREGKVLCLIIDNGHRAFPTPSSTRRPGGGVGDEGPIPKANSFSAKERVADAVAVAAAVAAASADHDGAYASERRTALRQSSDLLEHLVALSRETQRMNVLLVDSSPDFIRSLAREDFFDVTHNVSHVLQAAELPPAAMRDLLLRTWKLGPRLADVLLAHCGGHVPAAARVLEALATSGDGFDVRAALAPPLMESRIDWIASRCDEPEHSRTVGRLTNFALLAAYGAVSFPTAHFSKDAMDLANAGLGAYGVDGTGLLFSVTSQYMRLLMHALHVEAEVRRKGP